MIFQTKHKGTKQLSTVRLTLRPFAPQDAESCLRNWAADEEIYRYLSAQPQTADEVREWLSSADEAYADPRTYDWAIEEAHCGEVVGELFVDNFGTSSRRCEMDWKIGTAFQGKGYAAEPPAPPSSIVLDPRSGLSPHRSQVLHRKHRLRARDAKAGHE